jgi:hypothetical protein
LKPLKNSAHRAAPRNRRRPPTDGDRETETITG